MLPVILLTAVTTLFQIVTSMTLTNNIVSGKLLHRQRRLMVFPSGTVMQVRVHIAGYCKQGSPMRIFGFERLWAQKEMCTLIRIKSKKLTKVTHFCTKNPHLSTFFWAQQPPSGPGRPHSLGF
jgi:hypothetical protein